MASYHIQTIFGVMRFVIYTSFFFKRKRYLASLLDSRRRIHILMPYRYIIGRTLIIMLFFSD